MKKLFASLIAVVTAFTLSACAESAPREWFRGTGEISIVATTNVWADLAYQIGGEAVTSHAIIYNINQDPHSFEASAREQLLVNEADIVLTNGGGYDDFMTTMIDASPKTASFLDAVTLAGTRADGNEHIWFSIERVRKVAAELATRIKAVALPDRAADIDANLARFNQRMDAIAAQAAAIKAKYAGTTVVQTEPLAGYLLDEVGYIDLTPAEFSEAIEEERDVPAAALQEVSALIQSGKVKMVIVNYASGYNLDSSFFGENTKQVNSVGLSELLEQDPDTFEYFGDFYTYLESGFFTLKMVLE